jgi:hypothetical protein
MTNINIGTFTLERFFQYLSNTDPEVIASPLCSKSVRMTQTMLGVMVFITGIFAFLSASFAVNTAFKDTNLAVLVGFFWGAMIIWFDRSIVSTKNKLAILGRVPIALLIGLTVSIPLELKLFEDRLDKFLTQESQKENSVVIARKKQLTDRLADNEEKLNNEITKYREEVRKWNEVMQNEMVGLVKEGRTGRAGAGPAYKEALRNLEENKNLLADSEKKLQDFNKQKDEESKKIEDEFQGAKINQTYGFLSRYEALEGLKSESVPAWSLAWLIRMLFILVELFPAFIKLFLPYSIYDALLEAKRRDTIQVIHRDTNDRMEDVMQTPPKYPKQRLLEKLETNFNNQSNSPNP